eukprot:scaffold64203_cov32-Tisochrysis_lutea.AAC.3
MSMRSAGRKPMRSASSLENHGGATMPSCASLRPMPYLPCTMTRWSHDRASRQPPAGEWPEIAATVASSVV